jgi:hypothetical protein
MKHLSLLFIAFALAACSKEEVYGPWKLKNGQEVELLVDHRYGSIGDQLLLLPEKEPAQLSLFGFTDREPGYNYLVKARMVVEKEPPQDGSAYHLEFMKVISKEKYKGNEPFEIRLIQSYIPGGPTIILGKQDGSYYFVPDKIALTYSGEEVKEQLEEIWQNANYLRENWQKPGIQEELKWRSITATVTHDTENFGKAYRVQHIEFTD